MSEDIQQILNSHNIKIRSLNPSEFRMSQPKRVIRLPQIRMLSRGQRPSGSSGVRITNLRTIKPPDPELVKKLEEEKLRKQLSKEIEMKSRDCAHKGYECTLPVLTGREYCHMHILQDPTAPFRQCAHTYSNGRVCNMPTPVPSTPDKRDLGLCYRHGRAALLVRQRCGAAPPPAPSVEACLVQLQHHVKPQERQRTTSCASTVSVVSEPGNADIEHSLAVAVDPFKQIDVRQVQSHTSILSCCSDTESDADSVTLGKDGDARPDPDLSPDNDSDEDDPLRHAGIFTAEEAVSQAKNVLQTLKSAYIRQMSRLKVLLQTSRLQYLKALRAEKEQFCSINSQARSGPLTAKERKQLKKLKAYASFHRKHGVDAVLARKLHRKRKKTGETPYNRPVPCPTRCTFTEGGVRCSKNVIPTSKYCQKHILEDKHQVLFRCCGVQSGCREAVWRAPPLCVYHHAPPPYTGFTLKKEESDSEEEARPVSEASHAEDTEEAEDKSDFMLDHITTEAAMME